MNNLPPSLSDEKLERLTFSNVLLFCTLPSSWQINVSTTRSKRALPVIQSEMYSTVFQQVFAVSQYCRSNLLEVNHYKLSLLYVQILRTNQILCTSELFRIHSMCGCVVLVDLLGLYYCFSMSLIAMSIILSTLVIYIGHNYQNRPVPHFINMVISSTSLLTCLS